MRLNPSKLRSRPVAGLVAMGVTGLVAGAIAAYAVDSQLQRAARSVRHLSISRPRTSGWRADREACSMAGWFPAKTRA